MIEGQGEDSCGKSASDEEAHHPPAETGVLHGNQLQCQKLFSSLSHLFVFSLNSFRYVSTSVFME
ncbi:hypothetical protein BUW91_20340 [Priestia megaterium]|nr:hypothetical protein BUW91_20340 [Priestia megaterium]